MTSDSNNAVECNEVSFRYSKDAPLVLEEFDLVVPKGVVWLIEGNNGAGKSTLVRLLAGLLKPAKGRISHSSRSIEYLHQDYRRSLFPWKSVAWNICSPRIASGRTSPREAADLARSLADDVQLPIPLDVFPHRLSGGQAHLVTLLRSFAAEPDLLLLDEPASGLSNENSAKLWQALNRYSAQRPEMTTICVSHDSSDEALNCTRLRMSGSPAVVRTLPTTTPTLDKESP